MNEQEIFFAALDLESKEDLTAYLDEACGRETPLRKRIDALLHRHREASQFLEKPAIASIVTEIVDESDNADLHTGDTVPELETRTLEFLTPSDNPDALGQLGQYEILEVIGRGGMGIVLRGIDPKLNRVVAVKVLAPEFAANPTAHKRFVREAQAAAAVSHDHVVTTYAVEEDPIPHLAMEYINGKSLQQKIHEEGQLELKEVLRIARQVAAGLSAAHEQGLTHRDIKPSNILLQNSVQRVQITDFGLARATSDIDITRTGEIAGTPQYMSPEQARSETVDPRSDLFSLGSVMYAMCCGHSPFRADTPYASIKRVCEDEPRSIRENNPEIPTWMEEIIFRLLEKNPDQRFQSANEVADLLGKHLSHLQDPAATAFPGMLSALPRTTKPRHSLSRYRAVSSIAVLLLVLLTLGFTEASGVTDLTGTVIRMATGEGTLIIEVDDPTVEVSLDGEELSITGAGLQELKLRPGQYQFQAMKDGQPLKTELVSISRNGREVVRVTQEGTKLRKGQPSISHVVTPGAFVVLSANEKQVGKCDSLEDAILGSSSGDTIEIRGNGPFVINKSLTAKHKIRIRAAEGYVPIIRSDSRLELTRQTPLITFWESVVLEGIQFECVHSFDIEKARVILSAGGPIKAINCRILSSARGQGIIAHDTLEVENCDIRVAVGTALEIVVYKPIGSNLVKNSVIGSAVSIGTGIPSDTHIRLESNTICSMWDNLSFHPHADNIESGNLRDAGNLKIVSRNNLYYGLQSWMRLHDVPDHIEHLSVEDAYEWVKSKLDWHDEGSVVAGEGNPLLEVYHHKTHERSVIVDSIEEWKRLGTSKLHVLDQSVLKFKGGDVVERIFQHDQNLALNDFHLRKDSAGYQAGPNGEDIGANIDFVGPGEAYERFKQTDEYKKWREETEVMLAADTAQIRESFVIVNTDGNQLGRFDSLEDAVLGSSSGDTIEIRGNGPFVTKPIEIKHPLTIRAGDGFRPVIKDSSEHPGDVQYRVLYTLSPISLEGLEFQSNASEFTTIIASGSNLHATNCRFRTDSEQQYSILTTANVKLANCELLGSVTIGSFSSLPDTDAEAFNLSLANCLILGSLSHTHSNPNQRFSLALDRITYFGRHAHDGLLIFQDGLDSSDALRNLLTVQSSNSLLDSGRSIVRIVQPSGSVNKFDLAEAKTRYSSLINWAESNNLYKVGSSYIEARLFDGAELEDITRTSTEWNNYWKLDSNSLHTDSLRYRGGDIRTRVSQSLSELTTDHFRLREDSPGYQAGPNGEDIGANVDLVGPGEAYERFKQTDEYKQWQKETSAILATGTTADQTAEVAP